MLLLRRYEESHEHPENTNGHGLCLTGWAKADEVSLFQSEDRFLKRSFRKVNRQIELASGQIWNGPKCHLIMEYKLQSRKQLQIKVIKEVQLIVLHSYRAY